jgi:hypothetical protein
MLGTAMVVGAAGGFVGGFLGAALNGASFGDSLKAGVIGGITGAAMAWAGGIGTSNSVERYLAHAAVGCGSSIASGGGASGCGRGATAALIGHAVTNYSAGQGDVARFAAATVSGGVTSRVMGGSFANGATTAAYGFLFNEMLHEGDRKQAMYRAGYMDGGVTFAPASGQVEPMCVLECLIGAGAALKTGSELLLANVGMDLSVLTTKELTSMYSTSQKELLSAYFKGGSAEGILTTTVSAYRELANRAIANYQTIGNTLGVTTQQARIILLDLLKK